MATDDSYNKILIVEDSPSTRMFARRSLEGLGLEVVEAPNGEEALASFEREDIGLVLLDVGLPDIDGFEVAERIRGFEKGASIPIIMLTGKDDVDSIKHAFAVGATDFASKPVSGLILGQRILFVLESARRQREIEAQREELEQTQQLAQIGRWTYRADEGRVEMSSSGCEIFDLTPGDDLVRFAIERTPADERDRLQPSIDQLLTEGRSLELKHIIRDSSGCERVIYTYARTAESSTPEDLVIDGHSQDITEREAAEQRVQYMAAHDSLTGLKNQEFFRETLTVMLAQQRRKGTNNALLLVNLDSFARINDLHGRDVGDAILRTTAERLCEAVRESDMVTAGVPLDETIARVGGDEFSVVIAEIDSSTDVARVAVRILDALHQPIHIGNEDIVISGRIGIAIAPEDGDEVGELIANADAANRHARNAGGNGYEFYRASMNESARMRLGLETDFRQALLRKELLVFYQPRVDMRTGIVIGAEALSRWNHEELGWISPETFVQVAEESGLTFEFGRATIESVMEQMRSWRVAGYEPVPISINISPTLLIDPRLPELMQEAMEATGNDSSLVEIEITESVLIRCQEQAAVALGKLKALGLTISLDDFGTGYSALTHLQYFPVDVVKIDRSFVTALVDDRGKAIVRGVISMAHAMGLRVVAEGVENLEQRLFLAEEGCDEEQGYLVSRPVPSDEFERLFWPAGVIPLLADASDLEDD